MALLVDDPDFPTITRFAFYPEKVENLTIFKIPQQYNKATPMVTDKFVQYAQEAGLKGFEFKWLWSSTVPVDKS